MPEESKKIEKLDKETRQSSVAHLQQVMAVQRRSYEIRQELASGALELVNGRRET